MFVNLMIVAGLVVLGLVLRIPFLMRQDYLAKKLANEYWSSLPTVDEYIAERHGRKGRGICCKKCGSNHIWERYLIGGQSIHYCKQCKTDLYGTGSKRT